MLRKAVLNPSNRNIYRLTCYQNYSSEHQRKRGNVKGFNSRPNESDIDQDYIGPPDPKSNLRPVMLYKPKNESALEEKLRLKRMEVEEWNQNIWAKHNDEFYKQKLEFMKKHKKIDEDTLSADKMSEFYKSFLDKNWHFHFEYNMNWYQRNFEILRLSLQVTLARWISRKI